MKFDVIVSLPGFNRYGFIAEAVSSEDLGRVLAEHMGTRAESHYEGGTRECDVTVHVHPTYWTKVERDWRRVTSR